MGDWRRKAGTEKPEETPAKVEVLLTQPLNPVRRNNPLTQEKSLLLTGAS